MDRKLGGLILLALALPAGAADLTQFSREELCINMAMTIITGRDAKIGFMQYASYNDLGAAITAKGWDCEPQEQFYQIAQYRLADRRDRADRRAEALRQLNQQINKPRVYPAPPTVTHCTEGYGSVTCTTR